MDTEEKLEALWGEISALRRIVFYQVAQIQALKANATKDPAVAEEFLAETKRRYEKILLQIGDSSPSIAADLDIRKHTPEWDRESWMNPE